MQPGSLIGGKYRLLRPIGEGAMGVVWAALNQLTDREVALKLIPRSTIASSELRMRLLREARACGRIAHKNVVEIYDVGQTDAGEPFLVMQLLKGENLAERIARKGKLTSAESARIAVDIARGLAAAHAVGIVHRDLKPANVFLHSESDEADAVVKVLDFGVSKVITPGEASSTVTGSAIGSPAYMSPGKPRVSRGSMHARICGRSAWCSTRW